MSLKTMTITSAATITVAGGSPVVFSDDGVTISNGVHLIVPADADYQTRKQVTVKYRPPTLDVRTGVYGKDKKSMSFAIPIVLSSGQVVFNTVRIEREVHPTFAASSCADLNKLGAQLLFGTDAANFWANGSLS